RALALPRWAFLISLLGWLPGGIIFPLGMTTWCQPIRPAESMHLVISMAVSGLIALTYSVLAIQFAVVRGIYPRLWSDVRGARMAAQELQSVDSRLRWLQILAGLIPLIGAVLMVGVGPEEQFTTPYRLLVAALIGLGVAGFGVAMLVSDR